MVSAGTLCAWTAPSPSQRSQAATASRQWSLRFDSHASVYSADYEGQVSGDVVAEAGEYDGQPAHGKVNLGPYSGLIFSQNPG